MGIDNEKRKQQKRKSKQQKKKKKKIEKRELETVQKASIINFHVLYPWVESNYYEVYSL